jgi:hypothetical protein
VVSELVTNSILHAGLSPNDQISLTVRVSAGSVRGRVCDSGPGFDVLSEQFADAGHVHTQIFGETSYLLTTQLEAAYFMSVGALARVIGQFTQEFGEICSRRSTLTSRSCTSPCA